MGVIITFHEKKLGYTNIGKHLANYMEYSNRGFFFDHKNLRQILPEILFEGNLPFFALKDPLLYHSLEICMIKGLPAYLDRCANIYPVEKCLGIVRSENHTPI